MKARFSTEFKVSSCEGKEAFTSPNKAWSAARRRPQREAYHCKCCGKWHVGTNDKKKERVWRK